MRSGVLSVEAMPRKHESAYTRRLTLAVGVFEEPCRLAQLRDDATFHDEDAVAANDGGQSVRDLEHRGKASPE